LGFNFLKSGSHLLANISGLARESFEALASLCKKRCIALRACTGSTWAYVSQWLPGTRPQAPTHYYVHKKQEESVHHRRANQENKDHKDFSYQISRRQCLSHAAFIIRRWTQVKVYQVLFPQSVWMIVTSTIPMHLFQAPAVASMHPS
jgi:hypothetical protein